MSDDQDPCVKARHWLGTRENPFASLVHPQLADPSFAKLHYSGFHHGPQSQIRRAIEAYIVPSYVRETDLRPTRIITIRGMRGAGKTHLLHSLSFGENARQQILIKPFHAYPDVSFEEHVEYLLEELVSTLLDPDEVYQERPFDRIANPLTRRLLKEAIRRLDATSRLFATSPKSSKTIRLAVAGGNPSSGRLVETASELSGENDGRPIRAILSEAGLEPEQALRLITGHLNRYERDTSQIATARRDFYRAAAKWELLNDQEQMRSLANRDEWPKNPRSRLVRVRQLFSTLVETCAIFHSPVVFALDNAELLAQTGDKSEITRARSFFMNVAQTIDSTRGLLFLFFVENGLHATKLASHITDTFVEPRWLERVTDQDGELELIIELEPPTQDELHLFVQSRMDRHLQDFPRRDELPTMFPFSQEFQERELSGRVPTLRHVLTQLSLEYEREIPRVQLRPTPIPILEWNRQLRSVRANWNNAPAYCREDLHVGLEQALRLSAPWENQGWTLTAVHQGKEVGGHAELGRISLLDWSTPPGTIAQAQGRPFRLAVGMLLQGGVWMPTDLGATLAALQELEIDQLLVLWARPGEGNLEDQLPHVTGQVWWSVPEADQNRRVLRRIVDEHFFTLLAFPEWLKAVQVDVHQPLTNDAAQSFVQEQCQIICDLVTPETVE